MNEPALRALARAGKWMAVLEETPPPDADILVRLGVPPVAAAAAAGAAAAWRVLALIKLGRLGEAGAILARFGDLDADDAKTPWALRYCAAWLPGAGGRAAAGGAAFGALTGWCLERQRSREHSAARALWARRGAAAALNAARLYAKAGDPGSARAWARRGLGIRGLGGDGGDSGGGTPPALTALSTAPLDCDMPGAGGLDAAALDAAARLELALGNAPGARRLFEAAAAASGAAAGHAGAPPPRPPADAARAAALMRLASGDPARAAAGFGAVAESGDGDAVDEADAAVCLLHAGDLGGAAAGAARPLLGGGGGGRGGGGGAGVDPAALTAVALRNAAALADLAPDGRAARAALAAAVAAAGPPDDLDAGVLSAGR